ncbi:MAG: DUF4192 domain-containing protein [Saccharothrix sp.]|nr:DUF4192 domain-containing protein [Saccharothrix sp.]
MEQVQRSGERTEPLTDHEVADLAVALSDYTVRDACIATTAGDHALAAEKLWTDLTRQFPAPERAEPATLLAFSAYLRGDDVLAAVAVECAESAFPDHRLAELLRAALEVQMPPTKVHPLLDHAVEAAEQLLQGSPRD